MRENLLALLLALEQRFPPSIDCHHTLTAEKKKDAVELCLTIHTNGKPTRLHVEDSDLYMTPTQFCDAVADVLKEVK